MPFTLATYKKENFPPGWFISESKHFDHLELKLSVSSLLDTSSSFSAASLWSNLYTFSMKAIGRKCIK